MRGFADETEHVDAEVIENQGRPSHGRDIKTVPAGRDTGEYKPVGSGKNRAGQQPGANGQGVMLKGQMNPQIHGAEKIADTVALHAVKAGGGIQYQYFEFVFIALHVITSFKRGLGKGVNNPSSSLKCVLIHSPYISENSTRIKKTVFFRVEKYP
jgi:hypothetical protein